jgi:hypothetical protein
MSKKEKGNWFENIELKKPGRNMQDRGIKGN